MKLSVSNIAWPAEHDVEMYGFIRDNGFCGLEIAPTRLFPDKPYECLAEAETFADRLHAEYGLRVSSMQSLWYGRNESIFGSADERQSLINYTKQAVGFAVAVGCGNLVFGCPKNRNVPDGTENAELTAVAFFSAIADYAAKHDVVIALEPNPPIYNTNYINTTAEAFAVCRKVGSKGFKVNIDLGTMLYYNEPVSLIAENLELVNHIHLSEPRLVPLERREIHKEMLALPFNMYFSIEMANCEDLDAAKNTIKYISGVAT